MPEGDTLRRVAKAIGPRLVGERVRRVSIDRLDRDVPGVVSSVRAKGKHLLIRVGDAYLRTHLGLHGSWHRYPNGASWKRPEWQASLVIETETDAYVCFNAKEVDYVPARRLALHEPLRRLGPDLLDETVDFDEVVARCRRLPPDSPLDGVLLNQSVAAGIGNVYKNEVLFLRGRWPKTSLRRVSDDELRAAYQLASELLHDNLSRPWRSTTGGTSPRLWVYGRAGQPCLRCDTEIVYARGSRDRSTSWCPSCQPEE